jgi:hypothetical protein
LGIDVEGLFGANSGGFGGVLEGFGAEVRSPSAGTVDGERVGQEEGYLSYQSRDEYNLSVRRAEGGVDDEEEVPTQPIRPPWMPAREAASSPTNEEGGE